MKQAKCDNNFAYVSFYLLINDALKNPYFFFNCFNFKQASFPIYTGLVYIFRTVCNGINRATVFNSAHPLQTTY